MTATDTAWPYDAAKDDPLTALRIPVVGSAYPRWNYLVAFDQDSIDQDGNRPTNAEVRLLASFLEEYISYWYNATWKARMRERPFDIDGGANGTVFRKWGADDWGHRKVSWRSGPMFVPESPRCREHERQGSALGPLTLAALLDRIRQHGTGEPNKRWEAWKAAHPDVFGGEG